MSYVDYTGVEWENGAEGLTPLDRANLRHMDAGIEYNRMLANDLDSKKFDKAGGTVGGSEGTVQIEGDKIEFSSNDSYIEVGDVLCEDVHASQDINADGDVKCKDIGGQNTLSLRECFTSVSEGKAQVASAITDKGVSTASDATFAVMAENIHKIPSGGKDTVQYLDIGLSFVPDEIIYPS